MAESLKVPYLKMANARTSASSAHVKMRYHVLAKDIAQLHTLFALANLWVAKRKLVGVTA